ncbi:epidermal growth factor-like protein 7 isoform X10 [Equus caballus]|uniref:epidermal growth factor-like protein 7 isoform X10 n=1 Tax=Equus caballus TaxID=9796 RepID=UPI0038B35A37
MGHSLALAPLLSQATPAVCPRNARPFVRWKGQAPAQWRHRWPPLPRRAAATRVQGMTEPPSLGPSIGPPTAAVLGRPPPGLATPAAPAGRGPVGSPGPAEQQYASLHARTEGSVSSQAAATALQDGGATPARQTWMNAVLDGAAVPSAVSTPQGVIGASVGRGTAPLRMGQSACPREGLPGSPTRTPQQPTDWKTVPSGVPSGSRPGSLETPHLRWRRDIITFGVDSEVKEEVQRLRSRVDVLEQKLQLVLAPLHSLASRALEHGLPDPGSLLAHSFQQLDRIDSLSEQISFLEEQLGSCSCKKEL